MQGGYPLHLTAITVKQLLFGFIFLGIVLIGCERNRDHQIVKEVNPKTFNILPDAAKKLRYSQFMNSIEYIPLETSDNIFIGEVVKIEFAQQKYFILDQNKLLVFNQEGRFLFVVGSIGRGPGEYTYPYDFILDTIQQTIEVYCRGNRKLTKYNMSNGNYIEEFSFNYDADALIKTRNGSYLLHGEFYNNKKEFTSLKRINIDGSERELSLYYPKDLSEHSCDIIRMGLTHLAFSQLEDGILYSRNLDNNIYLIRDDSIFTKYVLDFGDANLPLTNSYLDKQKDLRGIMENTEKVVVFAGQWCNDSYIYTSFPQKQENIYVFYNIKEDELLYGKSFNNDIDLGPVGFFAGIHKQSLIGIVSPDKFLDHFSKIKKNQELWYRANVINPKIKDLCNTAHDSDNPILAICHLKPKFVN